MTDQAQPDLPPNTGRIFDYWFGGTHHHPVDVEAARGFEALFSGFPAFFKASRGFIGRTACYMREQGVEQFLVLGAGIPDSGNVHQAVPGARCLYTDIDRENIRLGQEILADVPNVGYAYFDVTDLSSYDGTCQEQVLGPLKQLGVIACGMLGFLSDPQVESLMRWAYELAPAGSYLAFDYDTVEIAALPKVIEVMKSGGPYYERPHEGFEARLADWTVTDDGIQPINTWRNPNPEDVRAFFRGGVAKK